MPDFAPGEEDDSPLVSGEDDLLATVTAWRDQCAAEWDMTDDREKAKYLEGKRDAFDVVLWKLREQR